MLLVHLSDLHFRAQPTPDPQQAYRTRLVHDAQARVKSLGQDSPDIVIISGDLAYSGRAKEYEQVSRWLDEVCSVWSISPANVFCVPGNHDVDRGALKQPSVKSAIQAIDVAPAKDKEAVLRGHLQDKESAGLLFRPLDAYNDFAKAFDCQVYGPERPCWQHDVTIEEGVVLRLHGLTSTLLSGLERESQLGERGRLYLSPLQTVLDPVPGVINAVVSHHPPDWLIDSDDVEEAFCGRAQLHCFGHKHRARLTQERAYLRLSAGAINPSRAEPGWEPGYNIIRIKPDREPESLVGLFEVHSLRWQTSPEGFVPREDPGSGSRVFHHRIRLPTPMGSGSDDSRTDCLSKGQDPTMGSELGGETAPEDAGGPTGSVPPERHLLLRFWSLKSSQRRKLVESLGLLTESDWSLPEPARYRRALSLAFQQGMADQVVSTLTDMEKS